MAIAFDKRIDLTNYEGNPEPLIVEQLSIIHESSDGEIVQYYIKPKNQTQTGGEIGHTGIVVEVTSSTIVTVEGNSSNQVKKNTYNRSNGYIAGYGHPLYSDADGTTATPTPTPAPAPSLKTCDAKAPLLKKGDTGNVVKNAQALLISKGYACGGRIVQGNEVPDGDFGPTTEKSVRSFQSQKKLDTDGIIGSDTWTALLTT